MSVKTNAVSLAMNYDFVGYDGGIYSDPDCSADLAEHAVLVVGYGSEHGKDYWMVKNSWGSDYGLVSANFALKLENGLIILKNNGG